MQNSKTPCLPAGRDLSIIIVNYRSEQYLKSCVASLFKYLKNICFEVIVVNNDEQEYLKDVSVQFPQIKIINHQKNIGFGAGCNLGAKSAQGEVLLFLNPDTEIKDGNIIKVVDKFKENSNVAVIGPKLLTEEGEIQWWCAGKEVTLKQIVKNNFGVVESKKIWETEKEIFTDWVSGTAIALRKKIFMEVGGFDEKFFMYLEDEDLCRRIRSSGHKVLFCPEVAVLHRGGKSRHSLVRQKIQYYKSLGYYFKKRFLEHV